MPKTDTPTNPQVLMLAYLCIKDIEGLNGQVETLDRFGLSDGEIALICGCAVQSVRNARQSYKKAHTKSSAKKRRN